MAAAQEDDGGVRPAPATEWFKTLAARIQAERPAAVAAPVPVVRGESASGAALRMPASPPRLSPPDDLLTLPEVAAALQVGRVTLQRWAKAGRLPAVKVGKGYRVRRQDLEAWYEQRRRNAPVPGTDQGGRAGRDPVSEDGKGLRWKIRAGE